MQELLARLSSEMADCAFRYFETAPAPDREQLAHVLRNRAAEWLESQEIPVMFRGLLR